MLAMNNLCPKIDYAMLFEEWTDFDDDEAESEAVRLVEEHGLLPLDAMSFKAFCYGYETALRMKEGMPD